VSFSARNVSRRGREAGPGRTGNSRTRRSVVICPGRIAWAGPSCSDRRWPEAPHPKPWSEPQQRLAPAPGGGPSGALPGPPRVWPRPTPSQGAPHKELLRFDHLAHGLTPVLETPLSCSQPRQDLCPERLDEGVLVAVDLRADPTRSPRTPAAQPWFQGKNGAVPALPRRASNTSA
jgi:hypothetical protein